MLAKTRTRFVLLLVGLGCAAPALAQTAKDYQVEVWEIRATMANSDVSKELRPIAVQLKRQFKYTGYKLIRRRGGKVSEGKSYTTGLSIGYAAKVTPLGTEGRRIKLKVEVAEKGKRKLSTTFKVGSGAMQLAGGWNYPGSKDKMIVGFRAR